MTLKRHPRRKPSRARSAIKSDRRLHHETLEKRELLAAGLGVEEGPRLISVSANSGEQFSLESNNLLPVAPTELTFRFGGELIDPSTLAGIQFRRSGGDGSFNEGNEIDVTPGFLGFEQDNGSNIIVARFAETLPDDQYVIDVSGFDDTNAGIIGLRDVDGNLTCPPNPLDPLRPSQQVRFDLEVGPRVVGVVPQPIETVNGSRVQRRDQVWVYFNEDPLSNPAAGPISSSAGSTLPVVNPQFYKLIFTGDTIEPTDYPIPEVPTDVTYDPALNRAVLTYSSDLSELTPASANGNSGTYRLRIGSGDALPSAPTVLPSGGGTEDTFAQALPLGVTFGAGTQSVVVTDGLIKTDEAFLSQWPGQADAVGSRDQRRDTPVVGRFDTATGINVFPYNFASLYGTDPQLNNADNAITEAQKQRAREVLELYSERLGVTFIETENEGLQIVTGDLRTIVISADTGAGADTPLSIYRVNDEDPTQGVLVLDAGENWYDGYGLSPDSRPSWFVEAVRGIGSLLGIGNLFELPAGVAAGGSSPDEPNSVLFSDQFYPNLPVEPSFISESDLVLGQALHRPEANDVDFYSFNASTSGRLTAETIAERLDGSSLLDTHLNLYRVDNGEYLLVARNDDFFSDDSFVGLDVEAGDYIIGVSASGNESYNGEVSGSGLGGVSEGRYELRITFDASTNATILDTTGTQLDGDADGNEGGDFNFWFRVARDLSTASTNQARTIFVDKLGDDLNDGSLGTPLRTISAAFALSLPGDIVRLLPNGGADGLITTTDDNLAYEIGLGGNGNVPLRDGAEFEVPRNRTVMIDAGAILKLQKAKISVGSESVDEDRSLAALQVLGTPVIAEANGVLGSGEVIFTSYNNEAFGVDTNPLTTAPAPGNWAGIEFRNDFDYSEGRPVWETEGIFLDYVSHANMSYGGGSIAVNEPVVTPLQMAESRPTLIYNTVTSSADAAMSADPNSFQETNFHAPAFQRAGLFTSDYDRVGPEIAGNTLLDNSINGLFVRVNTPAAGQLEPMTVSGRFDDTDIVHTLSQVLVLQGQPGGPTLMESRPDLLSTTLTPGTAGSLAAGTYDYRITYVDSVGNESLASLPTVQTTVAANGSITLAGLAPASNDFSGRRLYRLAPGTGNYEFVTQLDRRSTSYVDNGTTRGGILQSEQVPNSAQIALAASTTAGSLFPGNSLSYRITFVDSVGGESLASVPTTSFITPNSGSIQLTNIPSAPTGFVATRIYRLDVSTGFYTLVVEQEPGESVYVDDGSEIGGRLANNGAKLRPRLDARLSIDAGTIVKLQNSRIEAGFGADFYAEGVDGKEIVFTSRLDDTFGAGGTFDTNNDDISGNAAPADWGGLIFRQDATGSLDYVDVRFGGGSTPTQGALTDFNAIEILQADVRITNSTIQDNAAGSVSTTTRGGFGFNDDAAIFIRGSQPIIVDNIIEGNAGAAISVNPNALNHDDLLDTGRSTGPIGSIVTDQDNQGPLISGNRIDLNTINAMRVRSEVLTTESIWDDTDIVHYVDGQIVSATHHYRSGLRLKSDPEQSLVVKHDTGAELVGTGIPLDIEDRIGGSLQVLGTPGNPVILTSINDCTVGAGFTPDGRPMNDTLLGGACMTEEIIEPPSVPYVDVVIVMDESGSMGSTQQFSAQFIEDLEVGLLAAGIGAVNGNRYGAVGFGDPGVNQEGHSLVVGTGLFGTAQEYRTATSQFVTSGFLEDGYAGIDYAIANYPFRADAAKFIILATDEPRSTLNRNLNLNNTISNLQANDIRLQGILGMEIVDNSGQQALAIDNTLVYTAGATGGTFTTQQGGIVTRGASVADYLPLVQVTGGIAGDLAQIAVSADNANSFGQAMISSLIVQAGGSGNSGSGAQGDWQGLTIDTYANDRNVAYVIETEDAIPAANARNAIADDSQRIGDLAAHEYAGDETERLGFNIRGTLADATDVDVYSFTATGGTTVFLDIDHTSVGLDTVIELIDVNDNVLARSDNSFAESTDPTTLVSNLPDNVVRPLFMTGVGNIEGPNPLDAGMRVVMPGSSNSENIYYVRVRSANDITKGQYTLSVRLREADETIGSTVQFADIRFATNAINVSGAPLHSPLTADAQERLDFTTIIDPTPNNPQSGDEFTQETSNNRLGFTAADADSIGNLLTTDRGSLLVTGEIGNISSINADVRLEDVDVYRVDLFAEQIEPDVFDSEMRFVTTTFDVDYADGLGRTNTSLAVYDAAGRLILHSRDSNIADDVGRPLEGVDSANLAAGSAAVLDAHIGPVELPEGSYFVAVSNAATVPQALDQFFNPNATRSTVRLAPINSVRRVVEDTLDEYTIKDDVSTGTTSTGFFSDQNNYTAEGPIIEAFFDDDSIVPYTLDDIRLFVSLDSGYSGNNQTSLVSVNPFTGTVEHLIGQSTDRTADIALRSDGELFTYGLTPNNVVPTDGNSGVYYNISNINGAANGVGNDTINFQRSNQAGNGNEVDPNAQLLINAITYPLSDGSTVRGSAINVNSAGYVVGTRDSLGRGNEVPSELARNLFYQTTVGNGNVTSRGSRNANAHRDFGSSPYVEQFGSASDNAEFGVVDTGFIFDTGGDAGDITGIGIDPSDTNNFFSVTDNGGVHSFNPRDNVAAPDTSPAFGYNSVIPTVFHGVVAIDAVHANSTFRTAPSFTGMAMGPRSIENEAYRQTIFATTDDGWLYAIDIDELGAVKPANIFYNGRAAIPLSFGGGFAFGLPTPTGLAFSHLEDNPWHQTIDRGNNFDHGVEIPYDQSRLDSSGGNSLYYGFEVDGNAANNTIGRAETDGRGELAPGGSHGSVISRPFSLEGYSSADKPTLYFSYLLEVEANDDYTLVRQQKDSFRVFGAGDDGEWVLLATNNNFRDLPNADEYDYFNDTNIPVQEIFDDAQEWRQARIDIGPLAGNENVRIRFDFSTDGAMVKHHGSIDFAAVPGDEIVDREQITLGDDLGNSILFESVVGRDVVFPAGVALTNGAQFSVTGPDGVFPVRFVTTVPTLPGDVQFNISMTAIDVADAVLAILPGSLNGTSNNDGSLSLLAANDVTVIGDVPVGQSNPVQIKVVDTPTQFFPTFIPGTTAASQIIVPSGAELATGESITVFGPASAVQLTYVNIPTGAAGEIVFATNDTADDIARRIMPLLPADVGAIYDGNGVITFVNQTTIQLQASVSQVAINNFLSTSESRIRISAPDGAGLIDDETLTLVSSAGTFVVTFDQANNPSGLGLVSYQAADTIDDIVTRLQNALPAIFAPIRVGNDIHVLASSASTNVVGTAIQFGQLPSRIITLPDGSGLTDQEILRVSSASGTTDITFVESATAGPAGTVNFEATDSAGVILARLAAALPLDSVTTAAGLIVYGATNSVALNPGSQISTAFVNGQQLTIPAGAQLVNNEAVDIVVGGTTTTITFIDTAGAVGPNQVAYQAGDAAGVIASRVFAILDPTLNATISGSTISLTADAVNHQLGASNVLITSGIFSANVINVQIPDAVGLRNGEQITVTGNGTEVITFILRGTTVADVGTIQVYYDPTDLAADLYDEMVIVLLNNYEAYVDPTGMGVNIYNPNFGFFAFQGSSPLATINRTEDIDEFAIPITIPDGSQITSGETLTITQKDDVNGFNATTFTLRDINFATGNLNEITYDPTASAAVVTRDILAQLPLSLQAYLVNTREIYLLNATSVATALTSNIVSYESAFGAMPILVDSTLTTVEVAARLQSAFAEGIGRHATADGNSVANSDDYKVYGSNRIRLYNTSVLDAGSYGVSAYTVFNDGPFISSAVPADEFGESLSEAFATNEVKTNGASNNVVEGVYIDDIVIGFAERGEMVLNAPNNNTSFIFNPETLPDTHPAAIQPERQNETLLGGYALEIRTSDEYGVEEDYDPINLQLTESFGLGRSFDTNDRLSNEAVTLIVPAAEDLLDGDTFTLDDGDRMMTFEFDNVLDGTVTPGNVRILFNTVNSDPAFVASAVRDAINSSQVQSVLDITAATSDGLETATPTGNRVELFGDNIAVNHSGGRFLKVDLVAEETFQGRETSRQIPLIDHIAKTVDNGFYADELARSLVTSFVDGGVDTLVAVGKIGDQVNTGVSPSNLQDGAVIQLEDPTFDYDSVRIYLEQNQSIDIDVDTAGFSKAGIVLDLPVITVFPQERFGAVEKSGIADDLSPTDILAQSSLITATAAPGESVAGAFLQFQAPATGYYDVVVSSNALFGGFGGSGEYQLTIRPNASTSAAVPDRDVLMVDYQFGIGDVNRVSPQGQIIISSNFISDSAQVGILATNAIRGETLTGTPIVNDALPRPGSAALLRNQNSDGIIPGVVISNNVVTASGDAAIVLAGDTNANGQIAASTLFGRILNNTVVGQGVGDGIRISGSASPTILNNVVAFFDQGIVTTGNQTGDVIVGSNAYQNNNTDSTVAISTSSVIIPQEVDLFEDPARRVYIPAAGSNVIDSSFASLPDRADFFQTVKEPVGISPSPIIAPNFDAYGQPRVDDPNVATPGGVGLNVFIDRGAIDRADEERPIAVLTGPQDAIGFAVDGGDQDVDQSFVRLGEGIVEFFDVQLIDTAGTGLDPLTITSRNVILTENGRQLIPGTDYTFGYSTNSRTIRLTPSTGLWRNDSVYEITLNNKPRVEITLPAGDVISDGEQIITIEEDGTQTTFEFDSGFSLQVPQTLTLNFTGTNADLIDEEILIITSASGNVTRTFEVNVDNFVAPGNTNIIIDASNAGTVAAVRDAFAAALNSVDPILGPLTIAEALELSPVSYDANKIQLGSSAGTLVTHNVQSMIDSGTDSGLLDGDRFTYTSAAETVTFELTTDALVSDPDNVPITISRNDTPDQIAQAIATAISTNPLLGLGNAQSIGNGTTLVGGVPGDTLTIDQGPLALSGTPGVSPGAFIVPFLPTPQFSSALTATALQAAIRNSTAGVNVFSPGAGTLLVSGSQLVQSTFGGSVPSSIGVLLPAVSDLAGNAVRETRITDETRFTIIMPDVVFDYGDAPASYGTLDADNGARHTVADQRLPRLGQYLDTETDGTPSPGSDDTPLALSLSETGNVFSILNPAANTSSISVAVPQLVGGETLSLNINGDITVFELTLATSNPVAGNVPVSFVAGDTASNIATNLSLAIRGRIPQVDESIIMTLDATNATITLAAIDDEDGISTGTFVSNNVPIHLFTVPGTLPNSVAASDVIGFLNPLDPAGSAMAVSVIGSGLLDGWVDFDRNGVFELDEQVISNAAVVDGVNLVTFFAPANATAGDTWMRVRVSESGNLTPTGVSVGGEVEDFEITVKPIALPVPIPHTYTATEDTTLVVDSLSTQPDLFTGIDLSTQILPVRYFVGQEPLNGTLTVTDELSGEFTYLPNDDFYGEDTFTYRLSTQQNSGPGSTTASTFATVTISVAPVNDIPGAVDQSLIGVEDTLLVIPAADLLSGSAGHGAPAILTAPQNESDQVLNIASITAGGVSISNANQNSTATTTEGGTISAVFNAAGFITEVHYVPAINFNRDNLPLANGDPRLDDFTFTVIDDGQLFLDDGSIVASGPLTTSAQATIAVTATNDVPTLASELVSTSDARYLAHYAALSTPAPVPTEDTTLIISGDFLLSNDFNAPASAGDERAFINDNDGTLRLVDVSLANPSLGDISLLPNGDIAFVPAPNVFGQIEFIYEVEDIGKDIAVDGTETIRPERESISSFIVLEPTNDLPVAYDRSFTIDEIVEPETAAILPIDAATLINGAGVNVNSPITINGTNIVVPSGATLIDGETLTLSRADGLKTIVEFNTSGTKSVGTDVLVQFTTLDTADQIATLLETALRADGIGGTATADTIAFKTVASTATDTFTSGVTANATGVTVDVGSSLTGGETVTVTDSSGRTLVFEFSETGFAVGNPDSLVLYTDADDSTTVATSLRAALANNGITSTVQTGTGTQSIVQFVSLIVSIDDTNSQVALAGDVLTVPDGTNIINGETITINDGSGVLRVVEFNTTGVPSAGTDVVVTIADTDLADAIAANLATVLQGQFYGVTSTGADVTFHNVTSASDAAPVTSITNPPSSLVIPAGGKLIDGETVTLTLSDNTPVVIEFNTTGTAATNTDFVIQYSPADIADSIATRVETALRADGIGIQANASTLDFTAIDSILVTETPDAPGEFPATLISPFNEDDQSLRIVQFATDITSVDAAVNGDGTYTLPTVAGGVLTVTFAAGAFTTGFYTPATDYNEQAPFLPTDSFTYIVEDEDFGQTLVAGTARTVDLPSSRSLFPGTVTITVTETNDTPTFTTPNEIQIAEDSFGGTVDNVIQNVLPSMATALDEIANQNVTFSIVAALSNIPAGLMMQLPEINSAGGLTFYPAVDAVGTATYVIRGVDDDIDARSTDATVTVHVRPVNDAPRFNPAFANPDANQPDSSDTNNADDAWSVGRQFDPATGEIIAAPITYTLREDNSQPIGSPSVDYFIPFRQDPTVVGYNRPGLLDVFVAGPNNELDGTLGGSQTLDFFTSLPATTAFGGQLALKTVNGVDGVTYTPPLNYNNRIGNSDSFTYTVRDDSTVGGETYNLGNNSLSDDRLETSNTIFFDLNRVNDRPEFTIANPQPEAPEDAGRVAFPNFAFNIAAGPATSAFDEVDVSAAGQNVTFSLTSLAFPATQSQQFFTEFPTISPDGTLAFEAAPDVFGEFEFRVILTDDGSGNATRGDLISSVPALITVTIQPQNDAPVVDPNANPLTFGLKEDGSFVIPVNGDTVTPGLLTPFLPGPANEAEDIDPGGNQSVLLADPITASTAEGGTLTQVKDANDVLIALQYTPRDNFVGTDSFIYTVTDDGISVDIGTNGVEKLDPKFASHIVTLVVDPINDEPLFSGAGNVTSIEDAGSTTVSSWATNVQAGPPTAVDEAQSQSLQFVLVQTSGDPNLFSTAPQAIVIGDTATLTYQSAPDANGVATFEAYAVDSGPNNAAINDDNRSETKTFTIRVTAVNDAPTFNPAPTAADPDSVITIGEDNGPYNAEWATEISPGPSDEALQTVRFEVFTPTSDAALFQTLPTIEDDGFLRFTPATNANGIANLLVTGIDSEGASSETVSLQIIITEVNDAPKATPDEIDTNEDAVLVIPSSQLLANDIDPDLATNPNEVLSVRLSTSQFSFNGASISFDDTTGEITYDPRNSDLLQALAPGQELIDSFSYSVVDAAGFASNPVTVSLNVAGINDKPLLQGDTPTLNPDGATVIRPLDNDTDIDGTINPNSIQITLQPAFGSLGIDNSGVITYTPFGSFSTEDTFRYTVADNLGLRSDQATITVGANAAPIARDDIGGSIIDEAFVFDVAANDFDPDSDDTVANRGLDLNSIVIISTPVRGSVVPLNGGKIRYVPESGFVGADQFQYAIADLEGRYSAPATVDVRYSNSRLQNPVLFEDVNADGDISPLDALLIINRLAEVGGDIPVVEGDRGPFYYDANGNQTVAPSDILTVINKLAELAVDNRGQGEQISSEFLNPVEPNEDRVVQLDSVLSQNATPKIVDASAPESTDPGSVSLDFVDSIAEQKDDERISALDAAFGDLI